MLDLIFAPQNFIFGVAITLMFLLFILEIVALMIGGANDWVDGFLPDSLTEAHAEIGIDSPSVDTGVFIRFLSWLYVGKIPLLMLMVVFLAVFGLTGFIFQSVVYALLGFYLPKIIAVIVVWFLSLPIVRLCAKGLYKILPKDETSAINQSELVGRVGVITVGTATMDKKAEIKVKDTHGQTHYVMAFADTDETLTQGETVLLVSQDGVHFRAIKNIKEMLID
ncbi:MAG: YqiJ family protein [Moraxella sp.]|nr:YqiJ family protein [Moraxella sp.]